MVMTNRSDRGSHKPGGAERFERDEVIRGPIRGLHQGMQPCGAAQTGRTHGYTRPVLIKLKTSFTAGPSTHGSTITSLHNLAGAGAVHYITSNPAGVKAVVAFIAHHPDKARLDSNLAGLSGEARMRRMFGLMARWPDDVRQTAWDRLDWHYALKVVNGWTLLDRYTVGAAEDQWASNVAIARDAKARPQDRAVAVCWLLHIGGDMHQPLHRGHRPNLNWPILRLTPPGPSRTAGAAPAKPRWFYPSTGMALSTKRRPVSAMRTAPTTLTLSSCSTWPTQFGSGPLRSQQPVRHLASAQLPIWTGRDWQALGAFMGVPNVQAANFM